MNNVPDHAAFEEFYAAEAPWDIGRPQRPFVAIADRVASPVLDAGCGTGDTSLFLAARDHRVTGIDFTKEAIRPGRVKAAEQKLDVHLRVKDALTLREWDARFTAGTDSGSLESLSA